MEAGRTHGTGPRALTRLEALKARAQNSLAYSVGFSVVFYWKITRGIYKDYKKRTKAL